MIKIENDDVYGFEAAIRGMRNPMNSWDRSDSYWVNKEGSCWDGTFRIGRNDLKLMQSLAKAGNDHGKFARMINVTMDITAPLYWWKEFDTYKVGTVANSCSTMHKIHAKEFALDDFSHEHLCKGSLNLLKEIISILNTHRYYFNNYDDHKDELLIDKKTVWWQMIQLLPSSYNQKRTVQFNYQVLWSMYKARKSHKLDEWREFCSWIETLPFFKEIYLYDRSQNQAEKDS